MAKFLQNAFKLMVLGGVFTGAILFLWQPVFAAVSMEGFTFEETFTFEGDTFYADMISALSDPMSDGTYGIAAEIAFYGNVDDMDAHADDIEDSLEFKFKESGASAYSGSLDIQSVGGGFQEEPASIESAQKYLINSTNLGVFVDPGVYQVDTLLGGTVITSLNNICLPSFAPTGGTAVGSQECENSSVGSGEVSTGPEEVENVEEPSVGPPNDPSLMFDNFGDGLTQFDVSTAISNVPSVNWGDQLVFRAITEDYNVEVFGVNVTDLQNGNASVGELVINIFEGAGQGQYIPGTALPNLSIIDIINGELSLDDFNFPGVEIDEQEVFYDFFYDINAEVDLNGREYGEVRAYFGNSPRTLTNKLLIAEFEDPSGVIEINEKVYNSRNDGSEYENLSTRLGNGRDYYVGIYGVHIDELGQEIGFETLAVKRLATYSNNVMNVGGVDVSWDPSPYLTAGSNTVGFDISGEVQTYNYVPLNDLDLMFGYSRTTFKRIGSYNTTSSPNQGFNFSKSFENIYAYISDSNQFGALPIEPSTIYYAGIYERGDLISFQQVGRTQDYVTPPVTESDPVTPATTTTNPADGLFSQSPMAALEAELSTGIVPCTDNCNYDKLVEMVQRAWKFVFIMIIPIAAIAFAYAGFLLMFQGSNPESRKKARGIFIKVFIGIAIVLAAFVIVKTILVTLGVDQANSLIDLS